VCCHCTTSGPASPAVVAGACVAWCACVIACLQGCAVHRIYDCWAHANTYIRTVSTYKYVCNPHMSRLRTQIRHTHVSERVQCIPCNMRPALPMLLAWCLLYTSIACLLPGCTIVRNE
jgi:hypothetical protein